MLFIYFLWFYQIPHAVMQPLETPKHWVIVDVKYIMFVQIKCYFCIKCSFFFSYSSTDIISTYIHPLGRYKLLYKRY